MAEAVIRLCMLPVANYVAMTRHRGALHLYINDDVLAA